MPPQLDKLVRQIIPHIERQLLRYPVSAEDRRDLLQSTLLQVVRAASSFRGESSFSTWLFRVTANEAFMLIRSQRREHARVGLDETASIVPDPQERADILLGDYQRNARVRAAVAALPIHDRDVTLAYYVEELRLQKIADRFELTEAAVRSRLHRARARLREALTRTCPLSNQRALRLP
jgi:RNA polymerase sigma-70 factor (ECF subfamily)